MKGLIERTSLDPQLIDDVILGHANGNSEAPAIGRVVALDAGLPQTVPGQHVDRRCGSGLQAIINGAMAVATGAADLIVAGGTESMSNAHFYSTNMRWGGSRSGITMHDSLARARTTAGGVTHPIPGGMIETAENVRRQYKISRESQDELALMSHRRAVAAQRSGVFAEEIVAVPVVHLRDTVLIDTDENPRPDISMESLAALNPIRKSMDDDATVTAGNASRQNDAAALCIVTTPEDAARYGLRPLVRLVAWAVAGVGPETMGIGPVPATQKVLERARLTLEDMDLIELNEAFAAQALAVLEEWGASERDLEHINVHGSGISLGHPVGATGARILGTLAREMARRKARYGLEAMCIGGGQGMAAVWERLN